MTNSWQVGQNKPLKKLQRRKKHWSPRTTATNHKTTKANCARRHFLPLSYLHRLSDLVRVGESPENVYLPLTRSGRWTLDHVRQLRERFPLVRVGTIAFHLVQAPLAVRSPCAKKVGTKEHWEVIHAWLTYVTLSRIKRKFSRLFFRDRFVVKEKK